jgi:hypothetical protein
MNPSLGDQIREQIATSRNSAKDISAATGVPQSQIMAFVRGADLRMSIVERIASYLCLKIESEQLSSAEFSKSIQEGAHRMASTALRR